ncbi:chemotaxis protein CheR [Thiosulfatimonas sediminis]|uniref:protein-glutamate O-methyltransferase n=1 Tax=Thiosulfatimonas sediminis TaxID=2675054 RepID=A0A6F8PUP4_9GAMM|nr:CheR family methyltransferase [Thiosulfatimonas sediminis]BBP45851.1 chemotaxis protein CheR [Thiosulfatimonas sediminis]
MSNNNSFWVVLGASAGGLEALTEFLHSFKKVSDSYFFIAQHLDPKHPTILKDLLSRTTDMTVELLDEDITPQKGIIYIIAPGHNAVFKKDKVVLSPAAAVGPKPSIDYFLQSLASEIGEKAIVVILSGTGSDGAQGALAVKAGNGTVFAQDPKTARYRGMPEATIEIGAADLVLAPADIALKVNEFIATNELTPMEDVLPKPSTHLERIFKCIFDKTGLDFSGYKHKTINRRIARRMAFHRLNGIEDYTNFLNKDATEAESLAKDFLISVTEFFRDPKAFSDLKIILEEIVDRTEVNNPIRIWVPACANGEEAYSIAIILHELMLHKQLSIPFQIFASDIDDFALNQARKGFYAAAQVEGMEPRILETFFHKKEDRYQISKVIRDKVVFAKQNVIMDPPFSKMDLISCRNLLIYFSNELQKIVLQTFHFALNKKGFLFLGKSESALNNAPDLFDAYLKKSQIFIRKSYGLSPTIDRIQSANNYARAVVEKPNISIPKERRSISARIDRILLDEIVPAIALIDKDGNVLHIRGDIYSYLELPQGSLDVNIMNLAKGDIKMDIRSLFSKAKLQGHATSQSLFYSGKDRELLFINIKRVELNEQGSFGYLVSFLPTLVDDNFFVNPSELDPQRQEAQKHLENEIQIFKERLQTTVEELETINEEIQSTNEELQSSNEELQSTNEELQTSNEELQSTNEELSTVNQELEVKGHELEQLNSDLQNMLENMNEVVILLDSRLRVVRFTQEAKKLLGLGVSVINQTVTTIGLDIDLPNLRSELMQVLALQETKVLQATFKSKLYKIRLVPYQAETKSISGVIMFLENPYNFSELHKEPLYLKSFEMVGDDLDYALVVLDDKGVIIYANTRALNVVGFHSSELIYKNIDILMPKSLQNSDKNYLEAYLSKNETGKTSVWRDVSFKKKSGERILLKFKTEALTFEDKTHYIGKILTPEEYSKRYFPVLTTD